LIYRFIFFLCLQCLTIAAFAQPVNLVPNGGFEERDLCIYNDSYIEDCYPWFNPMDPEYINQATPDLFHVCAVVNNDPCPYPDDPILDPWFTGVPTNTLGCEEPYEGEGYAGAFLFIPNIDEPPLDGYREYLAVRLIESLQTGLVYDVSMQVSLAERSTHALWNFQVLLSPDSLAQETTQFMDYEPQLNGTPGDYIDNKNGWRELSWTYTAEGGEQFIYIGNFQPGSETDTLFVNEGSTLGHFLHGVYYYIDDVRVVANSLSTVDRLFSDVNIFPNPASDVIHIHGLPQSDWRIDVIDARGKQHLSVHQMVDGRTYLSVDQLEAGLYFIRFTNENNMSFTQKIIKR